MLTNNQANVGVAGKALQRGPELNDTIVRITKVGLFKLVGRKPQTFQESLSVVAGPSDGLVAEHGKSAAVR